jgi:uncharacterized protein (TIGR02246 family)
MMRRQKPLRLFCFGLALTAGLLGLAGAIPAEGAGSPEALEELKRLLDRHDMAFNAHDLDGVLELFLPTEAAVMGTGPGELWVGREEIGNAYRHFFEDFERDGQSSEYSWRTGSVGVEIAWLMSVSRVTMKQGEEVREFDLNISAVFEKVDGRWYIAAMHFSNLTGADAPSREPGSGEAGP